MFITSLFSQWTAIVIEEKIQRVAVFRNTLLYNKHPLFSYMFYLILSEELGKGDFHRYHPKLTIGQLGQQLIYYC